MGPRTILVRNMRGVVGEESPDRRSPCQALGVEDGAAGRQQTSDLGNHKQRQCQAPRGLHTRRLINNKENDVTRNENTYRQNL